MRTMVISALLSVEYRLGPRIIDSYEWPISRALTMSFTLVAGSVA